MAPDPVPPVSSGLASRAATVPAGKSTAADAKTTAAPVGFPSARGIPPQFDDYEILEEIARGGMGVVYKARQISLSRIVAVKMILSQQFASEEEIRRFQAEAETVAQLQHPNIVQVFAVGEVAAQRYLSLEFIDGGSLAQKIARTPQPAAEAAELVRVLAGAMHAAHQRGVVHRDLKPSNVLLTADGIPKIADFGLAKRVEADSSQTRTGTILGTPSYMAPEQAGGSVRRIGPATDVYALGAILYELLTGRPPFQAESPMETVVQVLTDEPVAPRRLRPKLPRDLETICLKCLQKAPQRRYGSAAELADDLQRFLEGKPIRARPVRAWERAAKWARRRPDAATLVLLCAAALLALVIGGVWYNARLQTALDQSQRHLQTAERHLGVAHAAIDRWLERVADDLAPLPHTEHIRRKLLRDALQFYQATLRQAAADPAGRQLVARTHAKLGQVHHLLGDDRQAEDAYRESIRVAEQLVAEFPQEGDYLFTLVAAQNNLANLLRGLGRIDEAEDLYRRSLARVEPALESGDAELQQEAGRIYNNLALLLNGRGKPAEAEALHRKALAIRQQLVDQFPEESDYRFDLAATYNNLGTMYLARKQYQQALDSLQGGDQLLQQTDERALSPEQRFIAARLRNNIGAALEGLNRNVEAEEAFARAGATFSQLATDFPSAPAFRYGLAGAYGNLGRRLVLNGKDAPAKAALREAIRLLDALAAEFQQERTYAAEAAQWRRLLAALEAADSPPAKGPVEKGSVLRF